MMISLLLPTKNRTEKLKEAIDSVSNTITKRRPIEILIGIEKDDKNTLNSINEINVPPSVSIKPVIFNQFEYVNNKYNILASKASGDLIFAFSDDLLFLTKNWDLILVKEFKLIPKDNIFVMWVNDGKGSESLPRHQILHKDFIKIKGSFAPPLFKHFFTDNWMWEIAIGINRYKYLNNIVLEHRHAVFGYPADDLVIEEYTKYFEMDKTLFNTLQSARIAEINKLKEYIEDFKKKNVT